MHLAGTVQETSAVRLPARIQGSAISTPGQAPFNQMLFDFFTTGWMDEKAICSAHGAAKPLHGTAIRTVVLCHER